MFVVPIVLGFWIIIIVIDIFGGEWIIVELEVRMVVLDAIIKNGDPHSSTCESQLPGIHHIHVTPVLPPAIQMPLRSEISQM